MFVMQREKMRKKAKTETLLIQLGRYKSQSRKAGCQTKTAGCCVLPTLLPHLLFFYCLVACSCFTLPPLTAQLASVWWRRTAGAKAVRHTVRRSCQETPQTSNSSFTTPTAAQTTTSYSVSNAVTTPQWHFTTLCRQTRPCIKINCPICNISAQIIVTF